MISVLVDTYNHEGFIRTAIESVLAQSRFRDHDDHEIVVVDDGSTDGTPQVLAEFGDAIRVVRKPNGGQASAFTAGLEACSGEIVMFLDGDDWWHEDKVARVIAAFEANPDCVAVGHAILMCDSVDGSEQRLGPDEQILFNFDSDAGVRSFHDNMAYLGTSRLAARRSALDRAGPPPDALTYEADEHFFTLLPAIGDVVVLPDTLTYYRIHGANLYQASSALISQPQSHAKLAKRAQVFRCLADTLPGHLIELGIPPARAEAIVEPTAIGAERLSLEAHGGSRLETWRVERRAQAYRAARGAGARLATRIGVFWASLILPPRSFYTLRTRYAGSQARRMLNGAQGQATQGAQAKELQ